MSPVGTVAAVARRLGRDPLPELAALGQLRANPHLGPAAEPDRAARAIEEELDPPRRARPAAPPRSARPPPSPTTSTRR